MRGVLCSQCSVRVMEIDQFMNSKRLFKDLRHRPKAQQPPKPVTVHINYHPDKHERMLVGPSGQVQNNHGCTQLHMSHRSRSSPPRRLSALARSEAMP